MKNKFGLVKGTEAKQVVREEVDTMEAMSNAQTQDVMAPATETAATPQVAEANQPEKVGFFTKVKTGIQNTGKKLWNNRGKIGVAVGAIGTIAGAIVYDRIRNGGSLPEEESELPEIRDYDPELQALIESETEEKTE